MSATLAATAVAVGLTALSPAPPTGSPVVVASHDLPAGMVLSPDDVAVISRPPAELPEGVATTRAHVVGRSLAAAARRGEVLTDVRLVGPSLVDALPPGQVAAPVRIADAQAAGLVQPGDRIDVLAAPEGGAAATTVARDATVLARPSAPGDAGVLSGTEDGMGGLLLLAVGEDEARALAGAGAQGPLSLALRGS